MSPDTVLNFDSSNRLGRVAAVDTSRVLIGVESPTLLPRAAVGSLVAIQGMTASEFLIGMTERVTRQLREATGEPDTTTPTSFERIAKEGRKYGVSLLVVSQRPSDVSRTILSQCNNFLVLRLTNDQDQSVVRRLMPDSLGGILDVLPLLDTGEAFLLGDAILLPARIRLNRPRIEPLSATRDFWREWGETAPNATAISEAVETLRRQSRTSTPTATPAS